MSLVPIYIQNYKTETEQGILNYSVIGALPNEMPNVTTKQYTWNIISHLILEKCSRKIVVSYDFQESDFIEKIIFEDQLMGTIQYGSTVYNAKHYMNYEYDTDLLKLTLTIYFPLDIEICGKDISWNIFINDFLRALSFDTM